MMGIKLRSICLMILALVITSGCISDSSDLVDEDTYKISIGEDQGFADYKEVIYDVDPRSDPYVFDPSNIERFLVTQTQEDFLREYGFVIKPSSQDILFHEYYNVLKDNGIPIFVTTDSILHSFHILYDYSLRIAELNRFIGNLEDLTEYMLQSSLDQYENSEGKVMENAKMNLAYFSVAMKLLDDTFILPEPVNDVAQEELDLIDAAQVITYSPIFGYREDYSQYVPRGHYTRNADFERYFKAMMWYGRMTFKLKVREQTRSAILIVLTIQADGENDSNVQMWDEIYQTTSFFVGEADDLTIYDYSQLINEIYGSNVALSDLNDDNKLTSFIEKAKDLPDPKINSSVITDQEDAISDTKGFRFMGQRFIIDSYMFFKLVYDNVLFYYGDGEPFTLVLSNAGPIRGFPRGLDAFSVLGFEEAEDILVAEGDTEYIDYDVRWNELKEEFDEYALSDWSKNMYNSWMFSLKSFSESAGEGWPAFMQSDMWDLKELYTALGSWTQLRHDTILYAKQSYTIEATSMPPETELEGYVEPNPALYSRLLSLTRMARDGLVDRGLLPDELVLKFDMFEVLLQDLITISEKEISGQKLEKQEYRVIDEIGSYLQSVTTFSAKLVTELQSEADSSVALVADVHTDVNSLQVLEEGVGYPYCILVVVNVEDETYIVQGPVFSYYEFKHPLSDRLTDEKWQEILEGGNAPMVPVWAQQFILD